MRVVRDIARDKIALAVGIAAAVLQAAFCIYIATTPQEGSWGGFAVFLVSFPGSLIPLLGLAAAHSLLGEGPEFLDQIVFALFGSGWWFFLAGSVASGVRRFSKNRPAGL